MHSSDRQFVYMQQKLPWVKSTQLYPNVSLKWVAEDGHQMNIALDLVQKFLGWPIWSNLKSTLEIHKIKYKGCKMAKFEVEEEQIKYRSV